MLCQLSRLCFGQLGGAMVKASIDFFFFIWFSAQLFDLDYFKLACLLIGFCEIGKSFIVIYKDSTNPIDIKSLNPAGWFSYALVPVNK